MSSTNLQTVIFHSLMFKLQDYHNLVEFSKKHYGKDIPETEVSIKGWNWGEVKFDGVFKYMQSNKGYAIQC